MLTKECVWGVWKSERREKGGEKRVVRKWKVDSYSFYGEKKKER